MDLDPESKVVVVGLVLVGVLLLSLMWVGWYTHHVTPLAMAEKGLCWDRGTNSYQPCDIKK